MNDDIEQRDIIGFLYFMDGPQQGQIEKLYAGRNSLGTSEECDLVLEGESISAKHASVRYDDEQYLLRDLDSKNGTFVNGEEIASYDLQENDVIVVGDTKLKFKKL